MRGRGSGGFQLGAVTAVRSPGDGAGAVTAVGDEDGEELRKAFDAAAGEEGLLGLDGFRVSVVCVFVLFGWLVGYFLCCFFCFSRSRCAV